MTLRAWASVAVLVLAFGCEDKAKVDAPAATPKTATVSAQQSMRPQWFADVTAQSKVDFRHDTGPWGDYFMPDSAGSGGALLDFNNDGRLDILIIQMTGPGSGKTHGLYRQEPDGTFTDVTKGSGLDVEGHGMGAACGDVNNDGLVDVAITYYTGTKLFINAGEGKFVDVTESAGIKNPHWAASAAFVDYDRDGLLDLFVVNYIAYTGRSCTYMGGQDFCGPNAFGGVDSRLYRNRSKTGASTSAVKFEDVSKAAGIHAKASPGLGALCADFTDDGWQDIFVTNDGQPNHLWVNQKNGTFTEEAVPRGVAHNFLGKAQANMGIGVGDADGNGLLDLYVTHLTEEGNILWAQESPGVFRDVTAKTDLARVVTRATGFGTTLSDFDNDGDPDIAVGNGRIARSKHYKPDPKLDEELGHWAPYAERNTLLENNGGKFADISVSSPALCGTPNVARGLMVGDLDNDGGQDLVLCLIDRPIQVLRNSHPSRGNWLIIRAIDPALGGRDMYGAVVTVEAGAKQRVQVVAPSYSYLTSNDPRVHFGLGTSSTVDRIRITWPDGTSEMFDGGNANRIMTLAKGSGSSSTNEQAATKAQP